MFDHRNQQFSTILVAATIMLGALVAVLAQGVLHDDAQQNDYLVIWYSISNSLSMSFLFICDVFCMGVLWRASTFMKKRSRAHFGFLHEAIFKTKEMVRSIRGTMENNGGVTIAHEINDGNNKSNDKDAINSEKNSSFKNNSDNNTKKKRRDVSHMRGKEVNSEFSRHEPEVNDYLEQREDIIDQSAYVVTANSGLRMENKSFEKFWQESCNFYANLAVLMFYLGSGSLIFANGAFVSSTFFYRYGDKVGGSITFLVIFITIPLSLTLLIYLRYIERIPMDLDEIEDDENNWTFVKRRETLHHKIDGMKNILNSFQSPFQIFRVIINRMKGYSDISSDGTESSTEIYSNSSDYPQIPNFVQYSNEIDNNAFHGSDCVFDDDRIWRSRQTVSDSNFEKNKSKSTKESSHKDHGYHENIEPILINNDISIIAIELTCLRSNGSERPTIDSSTSNDANGHLNDTNMNSQFILSNNDNGNEFTLNDSKIDDSRCCIDGSYDCTE